MSLLISVSTKASIPFEVSVFCTVREASPGASGCLGACPAAPTLLHRAAKKARALGGVVKLAP